MCLQQTKDHRRLLRLDADCAFLRWGKLNKKGKNGKTSCSSDASEDKDGTFLNLEDGIAVSSIDSVFRGRRAGLNFTKDFDQSCCFSIVYIAGEKNGRNSEGSIDRNTAPSNSPSKSPSKAPAYSTLDLGCSSMEERDMWTDALEALQKFGAV